VTPEYKNQSSDTFDSSDKAKIIEEVESAVWAFHKADTSMNAEQIISLIWPECELLIDGNRITYSDMSAGSRSFMSSLDLFHSDWNDLRILPVSNNEAISSFIFRDSIISKDGTLTQSQGPNTFVWQKRSEEWRIIYVDADHYPVEH